MCSDTAYGKYSCSGFPWTLVGILHCFLCQSSAESDGNWQFDGISRKYGRCSVLRDGLCSYEKADHDLYSGKLLMGVNPAGLFVYIMPFMISTVAGSILAYGLVTMLEKSRVLEPFKRVR